MLPTHPIRYDLEPPERFTINGNDTETIMWLSIDTGGTFTDFVLFDRRSLCVHKVLGRCLRGWMNAALPRGCPRGCRLVSASPVWP